MDNNKKIKLIIEENSGITRIKEPVTVGIPFPRGLLIEKGELSLVDANDKPIPLQTEVLKEWSDHSIKWMLLDFVVDCLPNSIVNYYLNLNNVPFQKIEDIEDNNINIENNNLYLTVDTGKAMFTIDKKVFIPFKSVKIKGVELTNFQNSSVILGDEAQSEFVPVIKNINIETRGLLRSTIKIEGKFKSKSGKIFSDFFTRLSFYAGKSVVKIEFTIRNPKAAKHPGGFWDIGDEGSIFYDDLSMHFSLPLKQDVSISWKTQLNQKLRKLNKTRLEIYQDSSGGDNWNSPSHVNRYGKVMNSFRGYRVNSESLLEEGHRASPTIAITSDNITVTAAIMDFWQNFPKSIEAKENKLTIRLFPKQHNDFFELQGGEQKTHTCYLNFENNERKSLGLDWIFDPLVPQTNPDWFAKTMAIGYMAPMEKNKNSYYQKLVNNLIDGNNSVFKNRERVDEFGWRHFGDVYANHEKVGYRGSQSTFVSHYNNQYDMIYGCILQFARTGDLKWYELMNNLARHVIDIDIYHTKSDRVAFNCGFFWHTDHFMHAQTSTHRSFSKKNREYNPEISSSYCAGSGGLSPEHCYTTGLCKYYFLTGNVMAKDAVIGLADWIMNQDRMDKNLLGILRKIKRTISLLLNEHDGAPGRLQGNSINTLLDGYEITYDKKYLKKVEEIIKKYISPYDDIVKLNQQQIEFRWSYLVFLQGIGKYLDMKESINEQDRMFNYAKESLMHHARFMLENEVPYKQLFHLVEIPSSTWSAQDIRKSVVLDYAYKYSEGSLKQAFKKKSEYFYNTSINDVLSFNDESKSFVRPLAVLMNYGVMHTYFQNMKNTSN